MPETIDPALATRPRQSDGSQMDLGGILRALLVHKWWILGVTTVIGLSVTAWVLREPKVYEAVCSLEYDPSPPRPLGSDIEDVAGQAGEFWMNREFYETQNRIIASRVIAERVVRDLELHHNADYAQIPQSRRRGWRGRSVEATAQQLQQSVTVEQVRNTRLVLIRVRDGDPDRAATLANAIADAYIDKVMQDRLGSTVSALEWLRQQLDTLRTQLGDAELALHDFKREHNVLSVSIEDRQNLVASEIQHFNEALTGARTKRIELQARLRQLEQANRENPEQVFATSIITNPTVASLRESIRQKRNERQGMAAGVRGTPYGENHPAMRALDQEIEALRTQLRGEIDGLIQASMADLSEVRNVEDGMSAALQTAHRDGLELNLREIEYRRLDRDQTNTAKLYELVLQRTTETDLTQMLRVAHVRTVDRALPPSTYVSPNVLVTISVGALVGLVAGLLLALGLAYTDSRVKTVEDVEALGLTILGVLPDLDGPKKQMGRAARPAGVEPSARDLIVHTHPRSAMAEACRTLRTNLAFMTTKPRPGVRATGGVRGLVVTSPAPSEGKTTVAVSLAVAFAQSGKRVLLVDSDLRRPRIHRTFGIAGRAGLTSLLVSEASLGDVVWSSPVPGLDILPCGPVPPNPAELLHGVRFASFLEDVLARYDHVIFDSPPLGAVTDAAILGPQLDGVLVVLRPNQSLRKSVQASLRQLRDVHATLVGGVMNGITGRGGRYGEGYYYSNYWYGYYTSDTEDDDDVPPTPEQRPPLVS